MWSTRPSGAGSGSGRVPASHASACPVALLSTFDLATSMLRLTATTTWLAISFSFLLVVAFLITRTLP